MRIIFVAFAENTLARNVLSGMIKRDLIPTDIFMASSLALKSYRKKSIIRYFKKNGLFNTLWRISYRVTVRKDVRKSSIKLSGNTHTSTIELAKKQNIPVGYFDNINEKGFVAKLKIINPDLIILAGAPLIKKSVIDVPKIAVLNSHPGLLPQAKGMDVVSQSLLNDIPLGVTVFKVDTGMDTGDFLLKNELKVENLKGMKLHEIEALVEDLSAQSMLEAIDIINTGNYKFTKQEGQGIVFSALTYKTYLKVKKFLKKIN